MAHRLTVFTANMLMRRTESMVNALEDGSCRIHHIIEATIANLTTCELNLPSKNVEAVIWALEMAQLLVHLNELVGAQIYIKMSRDLAIYDFTKDMARDMMKRRLLSATTACIGSIACLPHDMIFAISAFL